VKQLVLPERPGLGRLGRHVSHDPKSRAFAFDTSKLTVTSCRHARRVSVFDQGNLGSCTTNAGLGVLATDPFYDLLRDTVVWGEDTAVELYSEVTAADDFPGQYPPDDTGSDGLTVGKVFKTRGYIKEYRHTFSLEDALKALSVTPVITGINWYSSFDRPSPTGYVSIDSGAYVRGGHEIELEEIDAEQKLIGFTNSWGTSWGANGRGYMSWTTFARLLNEDGDVTVFIPNDTTPVQPDVDATDVTLFNSLRDWSHAPHVGSNHRAALAFRQWAKQKGFE